MLKMSVCQHMVIMYSTSTTWLLHWSLIKSVNKVQFVCMLTTQYYSPLLCRDWSFHLASSFPECNSRQSNKAWKWKRSVQATDLLIIILMFDFRLDTMLPAQFSLMRLIHWVVQGEVTVSMRPVAEWSQSCLFKWMVSMHVHIYVYHKVVCGPETTF